MVESPNLNPGYCAPSSETAARQQGEAMAEQNVDVTEGPLGTFNDLLTQLQQEIEDVKSGKLQESQARVLLGFRKGQLKIAELGLQYLRLMKPRGGSVGGKIPILPGAGEASSATK
jgi:hypothetical protein